MASIENFKDLKIWCRGMDFVDTIYRITKTFPKSEFYNLGIQMRRSAVSIPSNIAEGFRRRHFKEYQQFLAIALGSCGELKTQLIIVKRLNYAPATEIDPLLENINCLCKMIHALSNKINGRTP